MLQRAAAMQVCERGYLACSVGQICVCRGRFRVGCCGGVPLSSLLQCWTCRVRYLRAVFVQQELSVRQRPVLRPLFFGVSFEVVKRSSRAPYDRETSGLIATVCVIADRGSGGAFRRQMRRRSFANRTRP